MAIKNSTTQWLAGGMLVLALGGCASGVNLDAPPVEDKTGTVVSPAAGPGQGGNDPSAGVDSRTVQPVDLNKANQDRLGPAGDRIIYFDYDSFTVKADFQPLLEAQARYLKADKGRKAVIEGHTDERGGREYNLALGQKRAEAVRRSLTLLGVPDGQIEAVSFGKEKLLMPGSDEAAMSKNRRAEVAYRP